MDDFDNFSRSIKRFMWVGVAINAAIIGGIGWAIYTVVMWLTV